MRALLIVLALLASAAVQAQGTWVGECTLKRPCAAAADPPAEAVACILDGLPSGPIESPVIDRVGISPAPPAAAGVQPRTCWWPSLVLAPGSYRLSATVKDAQGRVSEATGPLSVTALTPLAPPSGLRLGAW